MPHPIPHLHEILALEAQIRADKYDAMPMPNLFARWHEVRHQLDEYIWIKK